MKGRKILSLLMAIVFICGIFANVPLSAAAPKEKIEVILSGDYSSITLFDKQLGIYEVDNGLRGLYSPENGWLTECKWYNIAGFNESGFAIVYGPEGLGVINTKGEEVIAPVWDDIFLDSGVAAVCDNGLWGLLDMQGNTLLGTECESIGNFYYGLALVFKNGKAGFINSSGNYIVNPIYSDAQPYSESLAAVKNTNGKWGFVDTAGNTVIACQYDNVSSFINGFASVMTGDTVNIINVNNSKVTVNGTVLALEPVIDCLGYIDPVRFYGSLEDIAIVKIKGEDGYRYINSKYELINDTVYKYKVYINSDDYAITLIPNSYGIEGYGVLKAVRTEGVITLETVLAGKKYIRENHFGNNIFFEAENHLYNMDGKDLFGMEFDKYIYHYDDSNIINAVFDGQYVCIDFEGNLISPLSEYQFYYLYENMYFAVADDGRVKFCDKNGQKLAETNEYADAYVEDGFIFVQGDNGKWGVCNLQGKLISDIIFDGFYGMTEGMIKCKIGGKYSFLDLNMGSILKGRYENVSLFNEGYAWVTKGVLTGAIDHNGDFLIRPLYWAFDDDTGFGCNRFVNGVTSVQKDKNGGYGVINNKNQKLTDFSYLYISAFSDDGLAIFYDKNYVSGIFRIVDNSTAKAPVSITLDKESVTTYVDCYSVITETVSPADASDKGVSYTSANPDVATVDSVGRIYGVSAGTTTVTVTSNADSSVKATVTVTVDDRELHNPTDLIPIASWEGQTWLSDVVIERLAELGINKTVEQLTYGDLLEVQIICIPYIPDPGDDTVYFIPSIIGEFSNLVSIRIGYTPIIREKDPYKPSDFEYDDYDVQYNDEQIIWYDDSEIFSPIITTLPDSVKYLSNLTVAEFNRTYNDEIDENVIRNNQNGIPDFNLYKIFGTPYINGFVTENLSFKGISDITGLSLMRYDSSINLSYNYISDISELAKMNLSGTVDLSYNCLDLEDENTIAVIEALEERGCTVFTDGQFESEIVFFWENWEGKFNPIYSSDIYLRNDYGAYNYQIINTYGIENIEDIKVFSSDDDVATAHIEPYRDGYYYLITKATGIGEAEIYLTYQDTMYILYATVTDPRFFVDDIELDYRVDEYDPFNAKIYCYNDFMYLEYRKQGETEWTVGNCVYENGTYEVRYINEYGLYSNIGTIKITDIKQRFTKTHIPDDNLREYLLSHDMLYVGCQARTYFELDGIAIENLAGLSRLDFSNTQNISFRYNYITDISELAKLGLKNISINLSYNKIDFSNPANANALRILLKNNCNVQYDNQFSSEFYTSAHDTVRNVYRENYYSYSDTFYCYSTDGKSDVTAVYESGVLTDVDMRINGGRIEMHFRCTVEGTSYISFYNNGEFIKRIKFETKFYGSQSALEAPTVTVNNYDEWNGYQVSFSQYGQSYEYRKQDEAEWTQTPSGWINIQESGIYEFRYTNHNGNVSPITTVELKTTQSGAFKMYCSNGEWIIYDTDTSKLTEKTEIPETVDGIPVVKIQRLYLNYTVKSLYIPKTISQIINFNSSENLSTITVDSESPYFSAVNNLLIEKNTMTVVAAPAGISGKVIIPEGVKGIADHAFTSCYYITEYELPSTLIRCTGASLRNYSEVKSITVADGNPRFTVKHNALYDKYSNTLVALPNGITGRYTIPNGTLFIGYEAIRESRITELVFPDSIISIDGYSICSTKLEKIILPRGITIVDNSSFAWNTNLTEVVISDTVERIEHNAFWDCYNMKKIVIPASVNYIEYASIPSSATIYCVENSYAHIFAVNNGYDFEFIDAVAAGDANGDGAINASDLVELKKLISDGCTLTEYETGKCDLNGDGSVDLIDLIKVKKQIAGFSTESDVNNAPDTDGAVDAEIAYVETK